MNYFLATSTLENEVEYDDNIDIEALKNLANERCSKNPDYKRLIWKCSMKPKYDVSCMVQGGLQLEFVSISRVKNHMTCYKFE